MNRWRNLNRIALLIAGLSVAAIARGEVPEPEFWVAREGLIMPHESVYESRIWGGWFRRELDESVRNQILSRLASGSVATSPLPARELRRKGDYRLNADFTARLSSADFLLVVQNPLLVLTSRPGPREFDPLWYEVKSDSAAAEIADLVRTAVQEHGWTVSYPGSRAVVIADGELLQQPFVFSSFDAETLFVNGHEWTRATNDHVNRYTKVVKKLDLVAMHESAYVVGLGGRISYPSSRRDAVLEAFLAAKAGEPVDTGKYRWAARIKPDSTRPAPPPGSPN
ncbi:MAG: hypothetical protein DHS20C21_19650 [Gemmatimonadota bacterium]|nr:MAG: hypothetical protein DHS20C21_19650 [Gemmatimonadota bacterium]